MNGTRSLSDGRLGPDQDELGFTDLLRADADLFQPLLSSNTGMTIHG